jgi:O-acetyl-ADP-ribose deacetylase (regulator of RNase III)
MIRTVKGDITKVTDVQAIVNAAKIAVRTVARFLHENPDSFDLVEWVLFDTQTESVYEAEVTLYYNIRI